MDELLTVWVFQMKYFNRQYKLKLEVRNENIVCSTLFHLIV